MAMTEQLNLAFDDSEIVTNTDDYYTPAWIFEALNLKFDIDVASPVGGIHYIPAQRYFTIYDNGLAQDWAGQKVWMNPPYSKPQPWIDKWLENGNGIALLPLVKSKWLNQIWNEADGIALLPSNLKFWRKGKEAGIPIECILAAVGADNFKALKNAGLGSVR